MENKYLNDRKYTVKATGEKITIKYETFLKRIKGVMRRDHTFTAYHENGERIVSYKNLNMVYSIAAGRVGEMEKTPA